MGYINRLEIEFAVDGHEKPRGPVTKDEDGTEQGARELLRAACRVFVTRTSNQAEPPATDREP